jgi:hypothetical protein
MLLRIADQGGLLEKEIALIWSRPSQLWHTGKTKKYSGHEGIPSWLWNMYIFDGRDSEEFSSNVAHLPYLFVTSCTTLNTLTHILCMYIGTVPLECWDTKWGTGIPISGSQSDFPLRSHVQTWLCPFWWPLPGSHEGRHHRSVWCRSGGGGDMMRVHVKQSRKIKHVSGWGLSLFSHFVYVPHILF